MKKLLSAVFVLVLMQSSAHAANFAVITSPPTALSLIVLITAIACLFFAFKITALLKGGFLAKSWHFFIGSFVGLALSQLVVLFNDFEIFAAPSFIVPALMVISAGLFFYGVLDTKKTLE